MKPSSPSAARSETTTANIRLRYNIVSEHENQIL
jgi:hypothetical protein